MKKILTGFFIIAVLLIAGFYIFINPKLPVLTGYAAKQMCSGIFISDLSQDKIQKENLYFSPVNYSSSKIDFEQKSVESSLFGLGVQKAVFKDDLGCVIIQGEDDFKVSLDLEHPTADTLESLNSVQKNVTGVDYEKLNEALNFLFSNDEYRTLEVAVFYKDSLIGERYADGYRYDTPALGWSMTKSITSTLVGILVKNEKISVSDSNLFPEWEHDERKEISIDDLLQMQSGLEFEENYSTRSDATKMLFMSEKAFQIPSEKPLKYPIGSHWAYSSGTTNILSQLIRNQFNNTTEYHRFPYDSLFHRLGMYHTTMETDESGTYIGSSFCYGSARDWGRFGLLYLNNGNWFGEQIIDSTWVAYCSTANTNSNGMFGAHFWQNKNQISFPSAPEDLYYCSGFQGQIVAIIPSLDLVVVRMGLSDAYDINHFFRLLIASFS